MAHTGLLPHMEHLRQAKQGQLTVLFAGLPLLMRPRPMVLCRLGRPPHGAKNLNLERYTQTLTKQWHPALKYGKNSAGS